jgi:hypothetical protein
LLAQLPLTLIEEVGCCVGDDSREAVEVRQSLSAFKQTASELTDLWRTIMSQGGNIFPGMPPEVLWAIAEKSERLLLEKGDVVAQETESGVNSESLIIVDEGEI